MKAKYFLGYIETPKEIKEIGVYLAVREAEATIMAQADAIKMGINYKLVMVEEVTAD